MISYTLFIFSISFEGGPACVVQVGPFFLFVGAKKGQSGQNSTSLEDVITFTKMSRIALFYKALRFFAIFCGLLQIILPNP